MNHEVSLLIKDKNGKDFVPWKNWFNDIPIPRVDELIYMPSEKKMYKVIEIVHIYGARGIGICVEELKRNMKD